MEAMMSFVTGIVLTFPTSDEDNIGIINEWVVSRGFQPMVQLDDTMRARKHPQMIVLGAGYNYFPESDFIEMLRSLNWEFDDFCMILNPENAECPFPVTKRSPQLDDIYAPHHP
jgi:hypothetical protein